MSCEMYTPAGDAGIMLLMNGNLAIGKVMSSLGKLSVLDLYSSYSVFILLWPKYSLHLQNIVYTYKWNHIYLRCYY